MTTRRRSVVKQPTGSEALERRSLGANAPKQLSVSEKTKTTNSQNEDIPGIPMSGENAFDDANISDDEEGGTRVGDIYIPPPIPPYCSTESKGPRLIIRKIENNNFKSYAGKVVLGPFHHVSTTLF